MSATGSIPSASSGSAADGPVVAARSSDPGEEVASSARSSLIAVLEPLSRITGLAVAVLAVLVMIGWLFHIEWLKRLRIDAVSTNPATAILLLLSACALLLSHAPRRRRRIAMGLGVVVAAVGMAKVLSAVLPFDFVLDEVLFSGELKGDFHKLDNEMAVSTAIEFLLVGVSLVFLNSDARRRPIVAQSVALGALLVSLFVLAGYLYESKETMFSLPMDPTIVPMALPTALAFSALAVGILTARPERGLMRFVTGDGPGAVMVRRLLPGCLIIPLSLGWLRLFGEQAGWFPSETGVALLVVSSIAVFALLIGTNAGLIDRTEAQRRQAHEKLRESEVFYHSLVESLPQNILRKDLQGRFTFANQRCCETMGKTLSEILGKSDFDLFPRALAEKYRHDDAEVIRAQQAYETTEEHVTPDGQTHYVQIIKAPLRAADGRIIGIQVIFWDVTEQIRASQQLRSKNEQLQAMALSERAAHEELKSAQSRMVQSAKLAGLGEMVAGVAHEINNPLSFVNNNVAVLQRDLAELDQLVKLYRSCDPLIEQANPELAGQARELWERADLDYTLGNLPGLLTRTREGLRRIQRIVGDLRIFARLDEGDLDDVDLNAGIESTVNIILGNAKKKQVTLRLDLQPLPNVSCFAAKINQVVMNLVSNAIDASEEGGEVVIRSRTESGGVRIEVEDHGDGIDPVIREKIFDPFFTTKPVGVGTGLGLSISYGIVVDHGGQIEVESEPRQGARFLVHLPLKVPGVSKQGPDDRPARYSEPPSRARGE